VNGRAAIPIALLLGAIACDEDAPDPNDVFDGNVLIGDARALDATSRDAEPAPDRELLPEAGLDARPDATPDAALDAALDAGFPCEGEPAETLTATEARARAPALDGLRVDVTGTATVGALACTERTCPPEMPCCNTCTGTISVEGQVILLPSVCMPRVGCAGDQCDQVCSPVLGLAQTFRGVLRDRQQGPVLELERVLP
jgi:hypothetical protein